MRYSGGLLGGSWLTALTGDMGGGKFDGGWLVQNFENQNPANTLWDSQLSHHDYRNGIHQQLIVAIDDPAILDHTLNPPHSKTYFELYYYLSYDKADR